MFCHFGINTFYGKEWSNGTLSPAAFDPTRLDARQWVQTAQAAGMRYLIFTAKHHDGFCLWPTETTDYSVKSSPYQNGRGDVVGEIARACQEAGLHFGIYLSPWDRHESCYPNAKAYDDFYIRQNWFWQADDTHTIKSVEHLLAIYYRSVGYGANLLLNVPPDNTGLLDTRDCARLLEFTQALRQRFANPIPGTLQQEGATVHISFEDSVSLDHLVLQEHLNDGQIVDGYQIYVGEKLITQGHTIGHKKIDAFPIVQAQHIRIELSTPTARLSRLTAFRTGYESLPEIGTPEIDEQRGERIG